MDIRKCVWGGGGSAEERSISESGTEGRSGGVRAEAVAEASGNTSSLCCCSRYCAPCFPSLSTPTTLTQQNSWTQQKQQLDTAKITCVCLSVLGGVGRPELPAENRHARHTAVRSLQTIEIKGPSRRRRLIFSLRKVPLTRRWYAIAGLCAVERTWKPRHVRWGVFSRLNAFFFFSASSRLEGGLYVPQPRETCGRCEHQTRSDTRCTGTVPYRQY